MNQNNEQLEQDFSLAELLRMIKNMIRFGTIAELDEKERMKVRVDTGAEGLTNWLPWGLRRAGDDIEFWCPEPDEQVMIISPGGNMAQGVVMPSLYSNAYPANAHDRNIHRVDYKDGSWVEHDRRSGDFKLYSTGSVIIESKKRLKFKGPSKTLML